MATKNENVFASPWSGSDMVLVVEDQELHVHKSFLTVQSPVFKAMFDGHFREASEDKITLKEKNFQSMVQFIKELYPSSMFGEARPPLHDASRLTIMALAEEYQCVNLIKQCIDEAKITQENVLRILPYAVKYHQTSLPRMYDVINWGAPTAKLEKVLREIEVKETSNTMLLTKCRFLESSVVKMQDAIVSLICDFLTQKKSLDEATEIIENLQPGSKTNTTLGSQNNTVLLLRSKNSLKLATKTRYANTSTDTSKITTGDSRCSHSVGVGEISKINNCPHCKEKYKEKFLAPIFSCRNNTEHFFNMLKSGDDVATAVKEQPISSKPRKIRAF